MLGHIGNSGDGVWPVLGGRADGAKGLDGVRIVEEEPGLGVAGHLAISCDLSGVEFRVDPDDAASIAR